MLATEKILKALLENPKKEWKQAELAGLASCSKAFVSKLTSKLFHEGIIARPKPQSVILVSFGKALTYLSMARKLPVPIYMLTKLSKEKIERILGKEQGYALTLFSAAWHRVKFMRTNRIEFYTAKNKVKYFIKKLGNISKKPTPIMIFPTSEEFFRNLEKINGLWLVSPVQNYADLIALGGTATRVAYALAHTYFE